MPCSGHNGSVRSLLFRSPYGTPKSVIDPPSAPICMIVSLSDTAASLAFADAGGLLAAERASNPHVGCLRLGSGSCPLNHYVLIRVGQPRRRLIPGRVDSRRAAS